MTRALYYAAAATTAIAGMLHLMLGPNNLGFNINTGIFFIVGGIAQVFWIIPMVRRWGMPWYYVGIGGTIVLIAMYFITRMPGNPITGRGGPINTMAIAIEVFQVAFIVLTAAIIVYQIRMKKRMQGESAPGVTIRKNKKHVPILAGIVVALVLVGLFVLPMSMGRPTGPPPGPPGQPGPQGQLGPPGQIPTQQSGIYTGPSTDGMLQSNTGTHLMLDLTKDEQGYVGTYNVAIDAEQPGQ